MSKQTIYNPFSYNQLASKDFNTQSLEEFATGSSVFKTEAKNSRTKFLVSSDIKNPKYKNYVNSQYSALDKNLREQVENSAESTINQAIGVYDSHVHQIIEPAVVSVIKKYTLEQGIGGTYKYAEQEVSMGDVMKDHNGIVVGERGTRALIHTMDYSDGQTILQNGMNPNIQIEGQSQVAIGDFDRHYAPILTYAKPFTYTVNEQKIIQAHNVFGNIDLIDMAHKREIKNKELTYQRHILGGHDPLIKGHTLLEQKDESIVNGFGIPDSLNGLSDNSLSHTEFENTLRKIGTALNKKKVHLGLQYQQRASNSMIMSLNDALNLSQRALTLADVPATSMHFQNRLVFLMHMLSQPAYGGIQNFYATDMLNPTSVGQILDPSLKASLDNKNPDAVWNTTDRPQYLFFNDNSSQEQTTIFRSKRTLANIGWVPTDWYSQSMGIATIEQIVGMTCATPEISRLKIGVDS